MIYAIYHPLNGEATEPNFPAHMQQPDAVRYLVGLYYVDATSEPTAEEVDAFLGISGNPAVVNQIAAIEAASPITQRSIRELMLAIGQAFPAAQASVFYKKAAAQEAQVSTLRSQLK